MSATPAKTKSSNQSDLMLWIAGGAIAAIGVAWLIIMQPWSGGGGDAAEVTPVVAASEPEPDSALVVAVADDALTAPPPAEEATLDNPLRMAELAYDAGMLVEPEEYSAWTLYGRVLKSEPGNTAARDGLTKVADDLVRRGETALDQGRFDDARALVERIRGALPNHPGAKALALKIWPEVASTGPSREALTIALPDVPRVARVETTPPPAAPERPKVDPVKEASDAFDTAMAAGRLLTPSDSSAKHFVGVLDRTDANHEATRRARSVLSLELLSRATQSIEGLDPEAAGIWIDEAEALLGGNDESVRKARAALTDQLIAMESAKPVPASALKIATYVAPEYPQRALERNLQGWVDIEFTVGTDGRTRNVSVTASSHEAFFRREATDAVSKWQFEPRVFMGRAIEQTAYTRMRFVQ
jgi:TonB family protein